MVDKDVECENCGEKIDIDAGKPSYLWVTGWTGDYQFNMNVCIPCFMNKPDDIIEKLKKGKYE